MAHFKIGHSSLFPGGTRLFLNGDSGPETIWLHSGSQVTLELAEWRAASGTPRLMVDTISGPQVVSISSPVKVGPKWTFTVKAHGNGVNFLAATDASGSLATPQLLAIAGTFLNHFGLASQDLLANVFRGSDPARMHAIARMLNNNPDNIFNEKSKANVDRWGELACGTCSKVGGMKLLNPKTDYEDHKKTGGHLHKPITKKGTLARADVLYEPGVIDTLTRATKKNLEAGMPVLVSLAYNVPIMRLEGGYLVHTGDGAHTVLIVGCNSAGTEFLYVDPWPKGSLLKYDGGPRASAFPKTCEHLGVFKVMRDPIRGTDILRARPDTQGPDEPFAGDNFLEVIFGPKS